MNESSPRANAEADPVRSVAGQPLEARIVSDGFLSVSAGSATTCGAGPPRDRGRNPSQLRVFCSELL
ncbi:hypothetical protein D8S78_02435 [Natrialba swarupiae]|nr:hypothetical protein [Natrialba swarupiae]